MGVGRGAGGALDTLDFKNLSKKVIYFVLNGKKANCTIFSPPGKILEKSSTGPPWKKCFRRHAFMDPANFVKVTSLLVFSLR